MKTLVRTFSFLLAAALLQLAACKKKDTIDEEIDPPPQVFGKCRPVSEYDGHTGIESYWDYTYAADGKMVKAEYRGGRGGVTREVEIGNQSLVSRVPGSQDHSTIYYNDGDIWNGTPSLGHWELEENGVSRATLFFVFLYNTDGKLIQVQETTNYIGDAEYNVNIAYNEKGNVKSLQYEWTTGPNEVIPPIIIDGYDDQPNPYVNVKAWRFFNLFWAWDNYDPKPLVTALSQNNPTSIHRDAPGSSWFHAYYSYEYNEQGFPVKMFTKNTGRDSSSASWSGTYTYECP